MQLKITTKMKFITRRFNIDNFANLMFGALVLAGWNWLPCPKKVGWIILQYLVVVVVVAEVIKRFSAVRYDKEQKLFFNSANDAISENRGGGLGAAIILSPVVATLSLDANNLIISVTLASLLFNCPIIVLFKYEAWEAKKQQCNSYSGSYSSYSTSNSSYSSTSSSYSSSSSSSFDSGRYDPGYSYRYDNIYSSRR